MRGGMCANPFGDNERLDRIDFAMFASGTDSPLKLLYLKVISDAASDYLFFGLGKNGTTAEEFWYASEYFFTCRSFLPETWQTSRTLAQSYIDPDTHEHIEEELTLSDEELMAGCFDRHYEIAELNKWMPMDRFVSWLLLRRQEILAENQVQVDAYMEVLRATAIDKTVEEGGQIGFALETNIKQTLVSPETPEQVSDVAVVTPRHRSAFASRPTVRRPQRVGWAPFPVFQQAGQVALQL